MQETEQKRSLFAQYPRTEDVIMGQGGRGVAVYGTHYETCGTQ